MNITNNYTWKTKTNRDNSPLLPKNIRGLIVGKSGCGKTTLLINLLLQPDWLDYNHLYIYGNSLHQKEYQIIMKGYEEGLSKRQVSNLFLHQEILEKDKLSPLDVIKDYSGIREGGIKIDVYDNCDSVPDPKQLNINEKNLLVLDDCYLDKQSKAESYYSRGRHNSCDTLFLSQNYFRLPRHTIRENSNFIILFRQDVKNLDHIYADHCSDISRDEFKAFCKTVWKDYNFVTLDLTSSKFHGKYRKNLDCFYLPGINQDHTSPAQNDRSP